MSFKFWLSIFSLFGFLLKANAQSTSGLDCNLTENTSTQYCICLLTPLSASCSYGVNGWATASLAKIKKQDMMMESPSYSRFPPNIMPGSNYFLPDYQTDQNKTDFQNATAAIQSEGVIVEVTDCDNCSGLYADAEISATGKPEITIDSNLTPAQQVLTLSHEYGHHHLSSTDSDLNFTVYGVAVNQYYNVDGWSMQEPFAFASDLAAAGRIISSAQQGELPLLISTIKSDQGYMEELRSKSVDILNSTFDAFVTQEVRDQIISSTSDGLSATIANGTNVGFVALEPDTNPDIFTVYMSSADTQNQKLLSFKCMGCDLTTPEGRAVMFDMFTDKMIGAIDLLNGIDPLSPTIQAINKQNQEAIVAAQNATQTWGQNCGFNCGISQIMPVFSNTNISYQEKITTLTNISNTAINSIPKNTCTFNGVSYNPGQTVRAYSVARVNINLESCLDYSSVLTCGANGIFANQTLYKYSMCTTYRPLGGGGGGRMIP